MFKKIKIKWLRIVSIVLFVCAILTSFQLLATNISVLTLYKRISEFSQIDYNSQQLEPYKDENGYYSFKTDRELKVLTINDIHIGGGYATTKKDSKTIYEVMSMVSIEKPDLVILNGDNVFPVPAPIFRGGNTLNNKMCANIVMKMFDTLGVYYTTTFGNHDTEAFDFYNRKQIGKLYQNHGKYCIFESNYSDYGVSNQCILVKDTQDNIKKALLLIDSNSYVDNSIMSSINWLYDTIHDEQVDWAYNTINTLSTKEGHTIKSLVFCHIPVGEFQSAYEDLESNSFNDTSITQHIEGYYDEEIYDSIRGRIWYGGCQEKDKDPATMDKLFERLGPDGLNSLEAIYCGHDHVNNAVVKYKNVLLSYGLSMDNVAYKNVAQYGSFKGLTYIGIGSDGSLTSQHRNCYSYYNLSTDKYFNVDTTSMYYPNALTFD